MSRVAGEGQGFLMPFLPAVVIRSSVSCLQTGCIFGLDYFITPLASVTLDAAVQMQFMKDNASICTENGSNKYWKVCCRAHGSYLWKITLTHISLVPINPDY